MQGMLSFLITISLGHLISASLFLPRQAGPIDVPPACTSDCSELNTILQSCSDTSCLCTQLLVNDLATCFTCVGQLSDADFDTPQATINNIVAECAQAGIPLSAVLLPGEQSTAPPGSSPSTQQAGGGSVASPALSAAATTSTSAASPTTSSAATTSSSSTSTSPLPSDPSSPSPVQSTPSVSPTAAASSQPAPDASPSNTPSPSPSSPPASADNNGSGQMRTTVWAAFVIFCSGFILALS